MQIQPAPIPASIQVQQVQLPTGQMQVLMTINDATGQRFVFLSPEAATSVGGNLSAAGRAGNLIIPPGTRLPEPEIDMNDWAVKENQKAMRELHKAAKLVERQEARKEAAA